MGIRPQGDTFLSSGSLKMSVKHRRDSAGGAGAVSTAGPSLFSSAVS